MRIGFLINNQKFNNHNLFSRPAALNPTSGAEFPIN
jgi:hypothetical protein